MNILFVGTLLVGSVLHPETAGRVFGVGTQSKDSVEREGRWW